MSTADRERQAPKGPMYHGHGYGPENRWMVIHQGAMGHENICDSYLTKEDAERLAATYNATCMDGNCFVKEMSV